MDTKALREQIKTAASAIYQLRDKLNAEGYTPMAEDQAAWKKANDDYNAIKGKLDRAVQAESIEKDLIEPSARETPIGRENYNGREQAAKDNPERKPISVTEEHRTLALAGWMRYQMGEEPTAEQAEACRITSLNPARQKLDIKLYDTQKYKRMQAAFRSPIGKSGYDPRLAADQAAVNFSAALSNQIGSQGGYTVPDTLLRSLEINMLAYGGLLQMADTMTTSSGERMAWPTADDTGNKGRRLGPNSAVNTTPDPTFSQVYWDAYKYTSDAVLVPFELLQDSVFDMPNVLGEMLGERLGRILNNECTLQTGNTSPKGIIPAATTFSAASATAIAADDILKLFHAVDPAYRNGAAFMMHDQILLQLRLLKDAQSRYLWQSGMADGAPDRLFGCSVGINLDMDSTVASGKKTLLFGQITRYKIRRVAGVRFYRLQERYRDSDQDGFLAFLRADGNLLTAGTAPIKVLTH